jgi:hypothetical protein
VLPRRSRAPGQIKLFERVYPFAWLGILAEAAPASEELIYVADVQVLARALDGYYRQNRTDRIDAYSTTCLSRVWKVQRFSWWMTTLLHRFEGENAFDRRRQLAELDYLVSSDAAARTLAENYIGLPLDARLP